MSAIAARERQPEPPAELLELAAPSSPPCRTEELGAVLRLQLAAPIFSDPMEFEPEDAARIQAALAADGYERRIESLADLFRHSCPPQVLVSLTKELAQSQLANPQRRRPPEVASVLYYASLLLDHLRCHAPLSPLNREVLLKGVGWALAKPWLDTATRTLFEEGRQRLNGLNAAGATRIQPRLQDG